MKQARLRFYERYVCRADQLIEDIIVPALAAMTLLAFIWNISVGAQS